MVPTKGSKLDPEAIVALLPLVSAVLSLELSAKVFRVNKIKKFKKKTAKQKSW